MSLEIRGIDFSYGRLKVLDGVCIEPLPAGSVSALIGPNASGKSTLFRCVAGLLNHQAGQIRLGGDDLAGVPRPIRVRRVCYVPQQVASHAILTVFDVVLLARKHGGGWTTTAGDIEAVEDVLLGLGIGDLSEREIGRLSGGQQQLVAIAGALVRQPELLLLDEPTSALDLRRQLEVMTVVAGIAAERGITTLVAMHDLNLAARFADRLVLLNHGRIVADGPPREVLDSAHLGATYGVEVDVIPTPRGSFMVDPHLPDTSLR